MKSLKLYFLFIAAISLFSVFPQSVSASGTSTKQVLDSVFTYDGAGVLKLKNYYAYDQWGNTCKMETYVWNTNKFVGSTKYVYAYNADGKQIVGEFHNWDYTNNRWKPSGRSETVYTSPNHVQSTNFKWDAVNNKWTPLGKTIQELDNNGFALLNESYSWDDLNQKWMGNFKQITQLDETGNPNLYKYYYWNAFTSDWELETTASYSYVYTYDSNNNLIKSILQSWDKSSQSWTDSMKWEYTVNGQNKVLKVESYTITPQDTWKLTARDLYDYDQAGNKTLDEKYQYDSYADSLIGNQKTTRMYDVNGMITQQITFTWDYSTGKWMQGGKEQTTYTANGWPTSIESYYWDNAQSLWIGNGKNEYTYGQNSEVLTTTTWMWDYSSNSWKFPYKMNNTYDERGRIVTIEVQNWDYTFNTLVNSSKETTTYHENGKILTKEQFTWNGSKAMWIPSSKIDYTYDANANQTVKQTYYWITAKNAYSSYERIEYYYSAFVTGLAQKKIRPALFEVNSCEKSLRITFNSSTITVGVYETDGKLIGYFSSAKGNEQYVNNLQSRVYLVSDGQTTIKIRIN